MEDKLDGWLRQRLAATESAERSARPARRSASRLNFQLYRHLVNPRRHDEIVLREATDCVRRQLDANVAVAGQVQIGMVVLFAGDAADCVEEAQACDEILDAPFAVDALAGA